MGRNNAEGKKKWGTKHKDFWHLMKREKQILMKYESEHRSLAES